MSMVKPLSLCFKLWWWQAGSWLLAKSQQSQNHIFPISADSSSKLCKSQKPWEWQLFYIFFLWMLCSLLQSFFCGQALGLSKAQQPTTTWVQRTLFSHFLGHSCSFHHWWMGNAEIYHSLRRSSVLCIEDVNQLLVTHTACQKEKNGMTSDTWSNDLPQLYLVLDTIQCASEGVGRVGEEEYYIRFSFWQQQNLDYSILAQVVFLLPCKKAPRVCFCWLVFWNWIAGDNLLQSGDLQQVVAFQAAMDLMAE